MGLALRDDEWNHRVRHNVVVHYEAKITASLW